MLTLEARIATATPSRYVAQFCKHAAGMSRTRWHRARMHATDDPLARGEVQLTAECSETQGIVSFDPWGRCVMSAGPNLLVVRVEASDPENLQRIQDVVTRDLERFGGREHLVVRWQSPDELSAHPTEVDAAANPSPRHGERQHDARGGEHHRTLLLTTGGALGIALIVVAHLALAGAVVAVPSWLGWTAAGLIVVPGSMVVLHAVAPLSALGMGRHVLGRGRGMHRAPQQTAEPADEGNPTRRQ
jgi:hypothetical protein